MDTETEAPASSGAVAHFNEYVEAHRDLRATNETYRSALAIYTAGWNDAVRMLQMLDENAEEIRARRGISDD